MKSIKLILFLLINLGIYSQNIIKFNNVDGDDYPTLKGEIWFRNPNEINTLSVQISENGKTLPINLSNQRKNNIVAQNKTVIFLMVNPGTSKITQFDWYRSVILMATKKNCVQSGDKIQIMSFNQQQNGQLLYPSSFSFTDNSNLLEKQLREMRPINYQSTCGNNRTLIWSAIDQVLDLVEKENLKSPVSIIVVSDDNSCITQQANQTPVEKAKKLDVSIYGITRDDHNSFNSIEKICSESFGQYYLCKNNNLDSAQTKVLSIMNNIKERAAGQIFDFSYNTDFDNDGSNQPITITYPGNVVNSFITLPDKNAIQWSKANWLVLVLIIIVISLIVFFIIKNAKDSKTKQEEIEKRSQENLQRIKQEQQRIDAEMAQKVADQEREMNQMRLKTQQEQDEKRQELKLKHAEEKRIELLQEMRMRGNLPWLIVVYEGKEYRYEIDDPLFTIGRENTNKLCLPYTTISRRHAVIKFSDKEYFVEDLNSSNGVVVNNMKVKEIILSHGDVIQLGSVYLTFMI